MTEQEAKSEMERCRDPEYMLRNHVVIRGESGDRKPTEKEIANFLLATKYPQVRPRRGQLTFLDPESVLRNLPAWIKYPEGTMLPVPISHYRP